MTNHNTIQYYHSRKKYSCHSNMANVHKQELIASFVKNLMQKSPKLPSHTGYMTLKYCNFLSPWENILIFYEITYIQVGKKYKFNIRQSFS
jgi:hypothetical protein